MSTETTTSAGNKHNKSLKIVFTITLIYFIIEVIVGFMSNSLALLSDAAHMLTDVAGQALALFAIWMASKLRNSKKTYGYLRTEIFSALINAIVLIFISGYILYEAWQRFQDPPKVAGFSMLIVASIGLIINLISMKILKSGSEESINIKGAFLEVVADMLNKLGPKAQDILKNINGIDTSLATKIKENMFVFEDLLNLDTEYIMKILQNVDTGDVVIAMKNATEEDMEKVTSAMSQRGRDRFKEEFEMSNKVKIKDIEAAQRKMLDVAQKMIEDGIIDRENN